jgi:hypothetical protein
VGQRRHHHLVCQSLSCSSPPNTNSLSPRTTVEINVAIIAASIPCLKPLFKTLLDGSSAARRYGPSKYKAYYMRNNGNDNSTTNHTPKSKSRSGNGSTATATARSSRGREPEPEFEMYAGQPSFTTDVQTGSRRAPSAAGSEESILPLGQDMQGGLAPQTVEGGITKTSTVVVEFDEEERRRSVSWAA